MALRYHSGELEMQRRAGTTELASRIARGVSSTIPPAAREFLRQQTLAVAGTVSTAGQIWASPFCGEPGFLEAPDERTVMIRYAPHPHDPLVANLATRAPAGLLVIDLINRRRMRLNGRAELIARIGVRFEAEQVLANCPKYIQARSIEISQSENAQRDSQKGTHLTEAQIEWVRKSDTFFIATSHSEGGADASHRGGFPGFVRAVDEHTLRFPDYSGNGMFLTLGNLLENPRAGLLFLDFERGRSIQLTGEAFLLENASLTAAFPGAERLIEFRIKEVVEISGHLPHWKFHGYSPFNPQLDA